MLRVLLPLCLAACGTDEHRVDVVVLAGDQPKTDALVIVHRPNGERVSTAHVDASGRAAIVATDDSLITALFPPDYIATRLITVAAGGAGDEITIHGPTLPIDVPIVGTVTVAPATATPADEFWVRLPCSGATTTTWPVSIEIDAGCVGTNSLVPVLVIARQSQAPIAYAAGSVTFENGLATFAPSQWLPMTPNVAVISEGMNAMIDLTLWIDGVQMGRDDATNGGLVWQGLAVERTTVHARVGDYTVAQFTTRDIPGSPTEIAFAASDFLPAITRTVVPSGLPTKGRSASDSLSFSWANPGLDDADVLHLRLGWLSRFQSTVIWDVILPPDAVGFTSLRFEDELADLTPRDDPDLVLRYIDDPELTGFTAALAGGVHAVDPNGPSTIVRPSTTGQVRETWTLGYVP